MSGVDMRLIGQLSLLNDNIRRLTAVMDEAGKAARELAVETRRMNDAMIQEIPAGKEQDEEQ